MTHNKHMPKQNYSKQLNNKNQKPLVPCGPSWSQFHFPLVTCYNVVYEQRVTKELPQALRARLNLKS
jgi:hypothetical protein